MSGPVVPRPAVDPLAGWMPARAEGLLAVRAVRHGSVRVSLDDVAASVVAQDAGTEGSIITELPWPQPDSGLELLRTSPLLREHGELGPDGNAAGVDNGGGPSGLSSDGNVAGGDNGGLGPDGNDAGVDRGIDNGGRTADPVLTQPRPQPQPQRPTYARCSCGVVTSGWSTTGASRRR